MSTHIVKRLVYSVVSTIICCLILTIYNALYKKGKKVHAEDAAIALILVVVSSLRYGVGSDYFRYLSISNTWFNKFSSNIWSLFSIDVLQKYSFEVGYKFLSVISRKLSSSPYAIFWLVSIVIYVPIVIYCRKNTKDSFVAIAVYLLFGYWGLSLNVLGQSIAMVLLLFAEQALEKRRRIAAFLFFVCAETFHTTAVLAFALIILVHSGILKRFLAPTKRNLMIMISIGLLLRISTEVLKSVISSIPLIAHYARYIDTDASEHLSRLLVMAGVFIETCLVAAIVRMGIRTADIRAKSAFVTDNKRIEKVMSIIMLGIPFGIVGISRSDWMWLSSRFAEYFFIFLIVLIPEIVNSDHLPAKRIGVIKIYNRQVLFWTVLVLWHAIFAAFAANNNKFIIDTYLFH